MPRDAFKDALAVLKQLNTILLKRSRRTFYEDYDSIWFYQEHLFRLILQKSEGVPPETFCRRRFLARIACFLVAAKSLMNLVVFAISSKRSRKIGFYSLGKFDVDRSSVDRRSCDLERFMKENGFCLFYFLRSFGIYDSLKRILRWDLFYPESVYWLIEGVPQQACVTLSHGPTFTDHDLEHLASYYLRLCEKRKYRCSILRLALKCLGARRLIMLDDSRYTNELIVAAKLEGIETIYYMHGRQNEYHVGLMAYGCTDDHTIAVDRYYVWSEFFRDVLLKNSSIYHEENTFISGHIRPPTPTVRGGEYERGTQGDRTGQILFLCEQNVELDEVEPYLHALVSTPIRVIIRNRPGADLPTLFRRYIEDYPNQFRQDTQRDLLASLRDVDAVVGNHSTVLIEAWLVYTPAVKICTSYTYADSLIEYGVVAPCKHPRELVPVLNQAFNMPMHDRQNIKRYIWGDDFKCDLSVFLSVRSGQAGSRV